MEDFFNFDFYLHVFIFFGLFLHNFSLLNNRIFCKLHVPPIIIIYRYDNPKIANKSKMPLFMYVVSNSLKNKSYTPGKIYHL